MGLNQDSSFWFYKATCVYDLVAVVVFIVVVLVLGGRHSLGFVTKAAMFTNNVKWEKRKGQLEVNKCCMFLKCACLNSH